MHANNYPFLYAFIYFKTILAYNLRENKQKNNFDNGLIFDYKIN